MYRGTTLAWSARADTQPVAVAVADLGGPNSLKGVIVTLDEAGALVVSYLGTDPMLTPVGLVEVWGSQRCFVKGGGKAGWASGRVSRSRDSTFVEEHIHEAMMLCMMGCFMHIISFFLLVRCILSHT